MAFFEQTDPVLAGYRDEYAAIIQGYQGLGNPEIEIVRIPAARAAYDHHKWVYEGVPHEPRPSVTRTVPRIMGDPLVLEYDQIMLSSYSPEDGTLFHFRRCSQANLQRTLALSTPLRYFAASTDIRTGMTTVWEVLSKSDKYQNSLPVTVYTLGRPESEITEEEWDDPLSYMIGRRQGIALDMDEGAVTRPPQLVHIGQRWEFSNGEGPLRGLAPFDELVTKVEVLTRTEERRNELAALLGIVPVAAQAHTELVTP